MVERFKFQPERAFARGMPEPAGFRVLAGSTAMLNGAPNKKRDRPLRDELIEDGVLVPDDDPELLRFSKDYVFSSASPAGGIIKDGNCSGPQAWRHETTGQMLRDWLKVAQADDGFELSEIDTLPYRLPESPTEGNPFGKGFEKPPASFFRQRLRPGDLKETSASRKPRTIYFREQLKIMFRILNGPVPYIFVDGDGLYRRLDAGCLGFLYHGAPQEIDFELDNEGYILAAVPVAGSAMEPSPGGLEFDLSRKPDENAKRASKQTIREGAKEFRATMISQWLGRCALSGTNELGALDAAHIFPYCGADTNHPANGLLLRADIHRLFDRFLLSFEYVGEDLVCRVSESISDQHYASFANQKVALSSDAHRRPHPDLIGHHLQKFQRREARRNPRRRGANP